MSKSKTTDKDQKEEILFTYKWKVADYIILNSGVKRCSECGRLRVKHKNK